MKVAAIQMEAELANVNTNLKMAERLAETAFRDGAELVIIPEFFTTAMGFHPNMLDSVRNFNGKPMQMMKKLASKYKGIIGGSFIASRGQDAFNTFMLVFPDGKIYFLSEKGKTTVIADGDEFKVLAENELNEKCFASPAVSNKQIFIRSENNIFCIGRSR